MRTRWTAWIVLCGALLASCSVQSAACQFSGGFAALHKAIPNEVGDCKDNESYAANGDAVQHTTRGTLIWRKSDNVTSFTNGTITWVSGPSGLQQVASISGGAVPGPAPASSGSFNLGWLGLLGLLGLVGLAGLGGRL